MMVRASVMMVRASLWFPEHHHDGQSIIMVSRASLWFPEHHYGFQSIIMIVRTPVMMVGSSL